MTDAAIAATEEQKGMRAVLRRILGNAGILLGGRGLNAVLGLGYMAIAARALGASDLGILVLIHAFAQLVGDVMRFQSWQTVLQYGAPALADGRRGDFQRVVRFALVLDGASTAVGLLIGVGGAIFLCDKLGWGQAHAHAAAGYMLVVAAMVSGAPMGLMRLFDRFRILAQQTALVSLFRLIGSVVALLLHAPLEGFLLAWGLGQLGGFAYLLHETVAEMRRRDLLHGFQWRGGSLTEGMPGAWKFAWNTNLSSTLDTALTHVATLAIGALAGPAQAAYWKVGRQISDGIAKPARLLTPALYPELARLRATGAQHLMWKLARQVATVAGSIGAALLVLTAFFGPTVMVLIMGKKMAPAGAVMTWQVCAAVIGVLALPLEPMLISLGRAFQTAMVQLAVGIGFLAALPVLMHQFGLIGAGADLIAAELGLGGGLLWFLLKERKASQIASPTIAEPALEPALAA